MTLSAFRLAVPTGLTLGTTEVRMDPSVQAAIVGAVIAGIFSVVVAVIGGYFVLRAARPPKVRATSPGNNLSSPIFYPPTRRQRRRGRNFLIAGIIGAVVAVIVLVSVSNSPPDDFVIGPSDPASSEPSIVLVAPSTEDEVNAFNQERHEFTRDHPGEVEGLSSYYDFPLDRWYDWKKVDPDKLAGDIWREHKTLYGAPIYAEKCKGNADDFWVDNRAYVVDEDGNRVSGAKTAHQHVHYVRSDQGELLIKAQEGSGCP